MNNYTLRSSKLEFAVRTNPLLLEAITHLGHPESCAPLEAELFWIEAEGRRIQASEFTLLSVREHEDGRYRLLRFDLTHGAGVNAALSFLGDRDGSVELILQLWNTVLPEARFVGLGFPFLSAGTMLGLKDACFQAPGCPFESSRGEPLLELHPACGKVMSFVRQDGCGINLSFDLPREVNTQNCTLELPHICSLKELMDYHTQVRLNSVPTVVVQLKFDAVEKGWEETFGKIRKNARSRTDLSGYSRPELKWYSDTCLHHFAFVYSEEVYDYRQGRVDIDRLLEAGKAFGGYDVICLWHQYPRLGVDQRSQWDFFADFPGGIPGLARIVQSCHAQGVKLMLPYKPWDAPSRMSPEDTARQLAELIRQTDADGFFLDTMSAVPEQFRIEVDKVKPGCAFCTELVPENEQVLEVLTGSWQQSDPLPYRVPLLRYVFPEHHSHFISRWSIGESRDDMLKQAMMNGCGLVIWQDVFGAWLPYEEDQKERVRRWKELWTGNRDCFLSSRVFPLWPACQEDLILNGFFAEDGKSAIFTAYNHSGQMLEGKLWRYSQAKMTEAQDLWDNKTPLRLEGDYVEGKLAPGQVAVVRVSCGQ